MVEVCVVLVVVLVCVVLKVFELDEVLVFIELECVELGAEIELFMTIWTSSEERPRLNIHKSSM